MDAESLKTPAETGALSRYFHHQQQQQPPASFAIHQLLGLGADIRHLDVNHERHQLALQTVDGRHPPHTATPPTACRCPDCSTKSFSNDVDTPPNYLDPPTSHQLDLSKYDRPTSSSVAAYYRQHHGLSAVGATKWPYLRDLPPPLTPWSNGEPHLPRKAVHHHYQQQQHRQEPEQQHPYDDLQAYYCASRLQSSSVDLTSYDSVLRQCRNISYLPPNFGMHCRMQDWLEIATKQGCRAGLLNNLGFTCFLKTLKSLKGLILGFYFSLVFVIYYCNLTKVIITFAQ